MFCLAGSVLDCRTLWRMNKEKDILTFLVRVFMPSSKILFHKNFAFTENGHETLWKVNHFKRQLLNEDHHSVLWTNITIKQVQVKPPGISCYTGWRQPVWQTNLILAPMVAKYYINQFNNLFFLSTLTPMPSSGKLFSLHKIKD